MSKATDIRLLDVTTETENFAYRTPMKFGGRVVTDVVLLHVTVEVETHDRSSPASLIFRWVRPSAAIHSGKVITWDEMLTSDFKFYPDPGDLDYSSPAPVRADANGCYPARCPASGLKFK